MNLRRQFYFLTLPYALSALSSSACGDESQIDFYSCYGNHDRTYIQGRVVEARELSLAQIDDRWYVNLWRKLRQIKKDDQEHVLVNIVIGSRIFQIESGEEGYIDFDAPTPSGLHVGFTTVLGYTTDKLETRCELFLPSPRDQLAIISDFDDTVIVTDVLDKQKAIDNTLTLNHLQRKAVEGMPQWYAKLLSENEQPENSALFFVTGSPYQLQASIQSFLDYHRFPNRVIFAKKVSGDARDSLFDQFEFKVSKIERILNLYPRFNFVLVGDDGEKDPEVYAEIAHRFPDRIRSVWIRTVNPSPDRKRYPGQRLFTKPE